MLDFLILLIGINGIEALLLILFCIEFKVRDVEKLDLLLCWIGVTTLNYIASKYIVPPYSQILIVLLGGIMVGYILNLNIKKCIIKTLILLGLITSICEGILVKSYEILFNIEFLKESISNKFLFILPIRPIEFFITFLLSGGVRHMKFWWGSIEKKETTKKK